MNIIRAAAVCLKKHRQVWNGLHPDKVDGKSSISQKEITGIILQNGIWEMVPSSDLARTGTQNPIIPNYQHELLLGYVEINQATVEFSIGQKNQSIHIYGSVVRHGCEIGHIDTCVDSPCIPHPLSLSKSMLERYREVVAVEIARLCSGNDSLLSEVLPAVVMRDGDMERICKFY